MAKSMKRIHKVTITDMEATMTHTSKGELSDLNLTSGQWHYVENASDGGLRQSLGDDNCQGDFAEAIRRELKQRSARTSTGLWRLHFARANWRVKQLLEDTK